MVTTVLVTKLMNFPQINLNQMQKVQRKMGRTHYFRQATTIMPQSTFMRSGEYNVIALFFSARESYVTVVSILKTINLEELCTYFKWEVSTRQ